MHVEEVKEKHIPQILEIWIDLMDYHKDIDSFFSRRSDGHINYEKFIHECMQSDKSTVLVAIENETVVGVVHGCIEKHPPVFEIEEYGLIHFMAVKEEFRRKKIAHELVKKLIEWFHSKNISRIELHCSVKNSVGHNFWKSQGFDEYTYLMYLKQ